MKWNGRAEDRKLLLQMGRVGMSGRLLVCDSECTIRDILYVYTDGTNREGDRARVERG